MVNERLAKRPGVVGRVFKLFELGPRNYGQHAHHRWFRFVNYFYVKSLWAGSILKPVFSRLLSTNQHGPLNYSGMFMYCWFFAFVAARFRFARAKDTLYLN